MAAVVSPAVAFNERDKETLRLINQQLAMVVYVAAEASPFRLRVIEGMRSQTRQAELVRTGASQTLTSRHLTGHAVDLAPIVDGQVRWDWPLFYPIAVVMRRAAIKLGVPVRWGGVWDTPLAELPADADGIHDAQERYVLRCRSAGRRAFLDGPHFEIPANSQGFA